MNAWTLFFSWHIEEKHCLSTFAAQKGIIIICRKSIYIFQNLDWWQCAISVGCGLGDAAGVKSGPAELSHHHQGLWDRLSQAAPSQCGLELPGWGWKIYLSEVLTENSIKSGLCWSVPGTLLPRAKARFFACLWKLNCVWSLSFVET